MSEPVPTPEQLGRFLAGESPPNEEDAVRRWLAERSDRPVDVQAALVRVKARTVSETPFTPRFIALAAAAVLLMVAGAIVAELGAHRPVTVSRATTIGERDSVILADGSRILLGPGTRVAVSDREVELNGEAYFDVVHDDKRPFIVRTQGTTIRDIGTAFAVSGDSGAPVRVVVNEGVVEVRHRNASVTLHRGDIGVVAPTGAVEAYRGAATPDDVAWLTGRLVFRDASLADVAVDLRRWYGVVLRVTDTTLLGRHFTGEFAGDPPDRVLEVLALALGARIERRGDTAHVSAAASRK